MKKIIILASFLSLTIFLMPLAALSTIVVAVKTSEGIVIAADSRTTFQNAKGDFRIASDNTQKVFRLGEKVGALTFGAATINNMSISSLIEEFKDNNTLEDNNSKEISTIIKLLRDFFKRYRQSIIGEDLNFIIAGTDSLHQFRLFEYHTRTDLLKEIYKANEVGPTWGGQAEIITRLITGYDTRFNYTRFLDSIETKLYTLTDTTKVLQIKKDIQANLMAELGELQLIPITDKMHLQDAIDYSIFLIRTTKDAQRFSDGIVKDRGEVPGVGGYIDVAVITKKGFNWIQKKGMSSETQTPPRE